MMKSKLVLGEFLGGTAEGRAGAVDQDVDVAVIARRPVGERKHLVALGDIERRDDGLAALFLDRRQRLLGALDVDVGDHDGDADLGIADGDRLAEAAAAAGDDGDPSLKVEHGRWRNRPEPIDCLRLPLSFPPGARVFSLVALSSATSEKMWSGSSCGWLSAHSGLTMVPKPGPSGSGFIRPPSTISGWERLSS